jgi:hypothetical protein
MTPYVRSVLDAVADPDVREIVLCFGSQTGKTTTLMVATCWIIANAPGPIQWVFPNETLARNFSAERWLRMVQDSPVMVALLPGDRRKWKHLVQPFRNALMIFAGSNSPANLASNPCRYVILDEVDKLALKTMRETNAVELAKQRAKAFWSIRKVLESSTPTTEDGVIWQDFLQGDQTRSFWHCLGCGERILPVFNKEMTVLPVQGCESELVWDSTIEKGTDRWEQRTESSTRMVCCHCGHEHSEHDKTQLLREAVEIPTSKNSEVRSFHISSLYSPDITWGALVVKFRKAKDSLDGLQGFVNGELAEPWMQQDQRKERREAVVKADAAPGEVICRIITSDFQEKEDHWWLCREWYAGGHSRCIAWGRWVVDLDLVEVGMEMMTPPDLIGLDSGHKGNEIYRMCALHGWFACRGDAAESWPHPVPHGKPVHRVWTERKFDPFTGTAKAGRKTVTELRWSNPRIKGLLEVLRNPERSPYRWEIVEPYATEEYFRHLDGEYLGESYNPKTGKVKREWKKRGRRWPNHLRDCELENIAVAIRLGILKTDE